MKYKICPGCGAHNSPREDYCKCGIDITNVRATDEETEKAKQEDTPHEKQPIMVKICECCGHANPLNIGECQNCHEDLTGITPEPQVNTGTQSGKIRATLISLDEQWAYELQPGETMVGRNGAMSGYLHPKMYVSREHAMFSIEEGKLFVTHIGRINQTYVNGQPIAFDKKELHDGDTIGLGGDQYDEKQKDLAAFFVVRICECT